MACSESTKCSCRRCKDGEVGAHGASTVNLVAANDDRFEQLILVAGHSFKEGCGGGSRKGNLSEEPTSQEDWTPHDATTAPPSNIEILESTFMSSLDEPRVIQLGPMSSRTTAQTAAKVGLTTWKDYGRPATSNASYDDSNDGQVSFVGLGYADLGNCQPSVAVNMMELFNGSPSSYVDKFLSHFGDPAFFCVNLGWGEEVGLALRGSINERFLRAAPMSLKAVLIRAMPGLWKELNAEDGLDELSVITQESPAMTAGRGGLFFQDRERDVLALAIKMVYQSADLFDTFPMSKMRACRWSAKQVKRSLREGLNWELQNTTWVVGRQVFGTPSSTAPRQLVYVDTGSDGWNPRLAVQSYRVLTNGVMVGDGLNPSAASSAGIGVPVSMGKVVMLGPRVFESDKSSTYNMLHWSATSTIRVSRGTPTVSATYADYYLWLASATLQMIDAFGAVPEWTALVKACVKVALSYVAKLGRDVLHEVGHHLCNSGHCCKGASCEVDPKSKKTDCGHDLPAVIWQQYVIARWGFAPAVPLGQLGPSDTSPYPQGVYSFRFWSRSRWSIGNDCGCVVDATTSNRTWGAEARSHQSAGSKPPPALGEFLGVDVAYICDGVFYFHRSAWVPRHPLTFYWSLNPGCFESKSVIAGVCDYFM